MDAEFMRELIVLAGVCCLFVIGVPLMVRGHEAEPLEGGAGVASEGGADPVIAPRLNRKRKARARDAAERG
jgi:hypothetical protein